MPRNDRRSRGRSRSASAAARKQERRLRALPQPRARGPAASTLVQRLLDLAARILLLEVAPLVLHVLAAGKRDLDLRPPVLPVQTGRDQRQALLGGATDQALDLAL